MSAINLNMKKPMAIIALLTGALLLAVGSALLRADRKTAAKEVKAPEANDKRIVKNADGTFTVEYYWPYPAWHPRGPAYSVATLEEAKKWLARYEAPESTVVETK